MHRFANPARFMRIALAVLPWVSIACGLSLAAGLYFALFDSPPDYQQGDTVRIMYIHVPAAWMGMFCYVALAMFGGSALIWRHPLADLLARATAPIGALFTLICLVTGSLWGKPMWGDWWVWDARLTSMLILFFLYLGYIALVDAFDDPTRGNRAGAILSVVGVVNVPIIKWSVDWWNTQHQPASVMRMGGPSIHSSMLIPLLLMAVGFQLYYVVTVIYRVRAAMALQKLQSERLQKLESGSDV
jgi:heme exporter protein C